MMEYDFYKDAYKDGYSNAIKDIVIYFKVEGFPCCGCGMCIRESDFEEQIKILKQDDAFSTKPKTEGDGTK